ncbi:MAG: hypothetical protein CMG75_08790 [Candidatus Marinimicrobia bacterium]|nr:hypothetical protein [Candidatus Neomarinimicrobiota bacterium]MBF89726.1 hypothetical protein [Candidatus Neomarinimicrobiota bacterium]|tara:strand:- start:3846 stop:5099 length:1254 start_codon:yes stop_codon:yes gene_type:complete
MSKNTRLGTMMFLQYALWGAWLPVTARYLSANIAEGGLGFSGFQVGMILGFGGSIGAISAPFIAGQLADRYFSTERVLSFLLVMGGLIKWYTSFQTDYLTWLYLSVIYSVVYMPTFALTNSITFSHIKNQEKTFPKIRAWGTIGWIVASWSFPMIWLQQDISFQLMPPFLSGQEVPNVTAKLSDALQFSGIISITYGVLCFLLPHTPPKTESIEPLAFRKAFQLFKYKSFVVIVFASLFVSIIHQIYFLQTGPYLSSIGVKDSSIGPAMTIGQFSEIIIISFLGFFLKHLGFKKVMVIGTMAYFLRYMIFGMTFFPVWLIILSQIFHGICFAFFFATVFIYVDKLADEDVRHSAQTVITMFLGGGPILAGWLSGKLQEINTINGIFDYSSFWYTLSIIGLLTSVFFFTQFKDETEKK